MPAKKAPKKMQHRQSVQPRSESGFGFGASSSLSIVSQHAHLPMAPVE